MLKSKTSLRLRPAVPADSRDVWTWRNDAVTRRFSLKMGRVSWAEHSGWFMKKLGQKDARLYIVEDARRRPLGQVRVEKAGRGTGCIHIGLDARARGRGVGRAAIKAAAEKARRDLRIKTLAAHIKPENIGSVKAFLNAGFRFRQTERVHGCPCYRLELAL